MSDDNTPYLVSMEGTKIPMRARQIREFFASHRITGGTMIWREGMPEWSTVQALAAELAIPLVPPAPAQAGPMSQSWDQVVVMSSPRKQDAYRVFAFFFGALGVHNFYAGRTAIGGMQLGITTVLVIIWPWLAVLTWFWALGELALVDTDGDGLRLR
jgi:TM2 domain-containing membrane protein YozV